MKYRILGSLAAVGLLLCSADLRAVHETKASGVYDAADLAPPFHAKATIAPEGLVAVPELLVADLIAVPAGGPSATHECTLMDLHYEVDRGRGVPGELTLVCPAARDLIMWNFRTEPATVMRA